MFKRIIVYSCILLLTVFLFPAAILYAMQSTSYKINFDAVDVAGVRSTSTSYGLEDSVGQFSSGRATSTSYVLNAGYQFYTPSFISISAPADASMPAIGGLGGGISTTSVAWQVTTDNNAGYSLFIQSSTTPALKSSGSSFSDYAPSGANPDFTFSVGAASSTFGFTVEGGDTVSRFKDNGSVCASGTSNSTVSCWDGFSTSMKNISTSAGPNNPTGATTTVTVQARVGSSKIQDSGTYTATIVVTALTL